jgi:hypothetical protein
MLTGWLVHCSKLFSAQTAMLGFYFLSVQTAQLLHCSKLISAQRAWLVLFPVQIAWLRDPSKLTSAQTAGLVFSFDAKSLACTL